MDERMDIKNLIILFGILVGIYYIFFKKIEGFENNQKTKPASKACSQRSINDAYSYYTFGSPHFIR